MYPDHVHVHYHHHHHLSSRHAVPSLLHLMASSSGTHLDPPRRTLAPFISLLVVVVAPVSLFLSLLSSPLLIHFFFLFLLVSTLEHPSLPPVCSFHVLHFIPVHLLVSLLTFLISPHSHSLLHHLLNSLIPSLLHHHHHHSQLTNQLTLPPSPHACLCRNEHK